MRICLLAYGTRGDVQPFLALAHVLQERGADVRLVAPRNYGAWIQRAGVPYTPIPVDVQALMALEPAQRMLAAGDIASFFRWVAKEELAFSDALNQALATGMADADVVITHPLVQDRAAALAAGQKVGLLPVFFFPVLPSGAFPNPFITTRPLGPFNRLSHTLFNRLFWQGTAKPVQALRRQQGVVAARGPFTDQVAARGLPCLLAYDEEVFGRPGDWAEHAVVTGAWDMPRSLRERLGEAAPAPELEAYLAAGPAPVFLGFGSMPVLDGDRMLGTVRKALAKTYQRAVLAAGWSQLAGASDERLHVLGTADHDALFPACKAAVHHGGAGTTRASLRAGLPTWICSVFADQPFWGSRCRELGVGGCFPFPKPDEHRLATALAELDRVEVRERAARLGERLRAGDGLARAADYILGQAERIPVPH
jgi:sterol 3beta-glucosyltransferase